MQYFASQKAFIMQVRDSFESHNMAKTLLWPSSLSTPLARRHSKGLTDLCTPNADGVRQRFGAHLRASNEYFATTLSFPSGCLLP